MGYTNLDLLNEKLKKFMVRRTKEEVIKQLPDKIYETVLCEPSPEQKRHVNYYMQMIKKTMGIMCLVIFSLLGWFAAAH